jgi:hypothetical protein
MKRLSFGLLILGFLAAEVPQASALVCAAGVYRAGCVGARGAVVTTRPVYRQVCVWRAGVRVCR